MQKRQYGQSEFEVSVIGLGAGQIGTHEMSDDYAQEVLEQAFKAGVTLYDTARAYGASETRIGRFIQSRRERVIVSTKVGYGIDRVPDWSFQAVSQGIDEALMRMRTDYLDIVHLHSCSLESLERGEVIEALHQAREAGKVRAVAYSGENEALEWAIQSGYFDGVQCSVNLCDQKSLQQYLPQASKLGVIAKRPLANAFWRYDERPVGNYAENYWQRWQQLELESPLPMDELALRFAAFAPGVSSAIIGTTQPRRFEHNLERLEKGPLPDDLLAEIQQRFAERGSDWPGDT